MPELPDLVHLEKRLPPLLTGQRLVGVEIKEPIVIRMLLPGDFTAALLGAEFASVRRHGPFQKIKKSRQQVRVLIMDQAVVSCIGNAYADEILFGAGLHPKTFCYQLDEAQIATLHRCLVDVMRWGIAEVEKANPPLEVKARGHMRVRNRKDQPCPRCGAKIRRAGVRGFDAFFCPACQPLQREQFIDWRKLKQSPA